MSAERDGETFFFCSRGCREEFLGGLRGDGNAKGGGLTGLIRTATEIVRTAHGR